MPGTAIEQYVAAIALIIGQRIESEDVRVVAFAVKRGFCASNPGPYSIKNEDFVAAVRSTYGSWNQKMSELPN